MQPKATLSLLAALFSNLAFGMEPTNPHRPRAFGGLGAEGMKKEIPSSPRG